MLPFFVSEFSPAGNSEAHSEKRRALRIDVRKCGANDNRNQALCLPCAGIKGKFLNTSSGLCPRCGFSAHNPDAFPRISQWHMFGYRDNYRGATASDFHGLPFV